MDTHLNRARHCLRGDRWGGKTQLVPPVRHGRTALFLRFRYGSHIHRLNEVKVHRINAPGKKQTGEKVNKI